MNTQIRPETMLDHGQIHEVNRLAFGRKDEAHLVDRLRESDAFIPELSQVAVKEEQIIGHILFTKISIIADDQTKAESLALAPMAVMPGFQKQGIGSQLIRAGLKQARALHYRSVIVLGHKHYYPKFGFQPADQWQIRCPYDAPREAFMAIELVSEGLKGLRGMVKYAASFDEP